jgi:hypothetical protein
MITMELLLAAHVYRLPAKFCGQCGIFTGDQNVWQGDHINSSCFNNKLDSQRYATYA